MTDEIHNAMDDDSSKSVSYPPQKKLPEESSATAAPTVPQSSEHKV
ncbi:MAG: hypothetical protein HY298_13795 [Verrucomicrobia bacterium]|nr:hypothetical protein [Verrucomicrobiota bacterium]